MRGSSLASVLWPEGMAEPVGRAGAHVGAACGTGWPLWAVLWQLSPLLLVLPSGQMLCWCAPSSLPCHPLILRGCKWG